MPDYECLNNAPIAEAIVSVEVDTLTSLEGLQGVCDNLAADYPEREDWHSFKGVFEIDEESQSIDTSHSKEHRGYIIKSADNKKILHVGKNNLLLNKLRPYTSWEDLSSLYEKAWKKYVSIASPQTIPRIGIRYINSFDIPMEDWNTFLLMHPVMNTSNEFDSSSISMGEVFSKYNLKSDRYVAEAVVMLNIKATDTDKLSVVMDIDVRSLSKIVNYSGYHEIKDVIDRLRDFKNQIFFSNLPKAEELFS